MQCIQQSSAHRCHHGARPKLADKLLPTPAIKDYNRPATLPRSPPARTSQPSETQNLACSPLQAPFYPSTLYSRIWALPKLQERRTRHHVISGLFRETTTRVQWGTSRPHLPTTQEPGYQGSPTAYMTRLPYRFFESRDASSTHC